MSARHGRWEEVRDHVRSAYDRSQGHYQGSGTSAGTAISGGLSALAAGATYAAGRTGFGTDVGASAGSTAERASDRGPLDRAADTLDDLKDRVDGNPASRPGLDPTGVS